MRLIRIERAIANENHTRARNGSIRAIKSPIAGAPRRPISTPTGAIKRRLYKALAIIGFSIHQPKKHETYTNRSHHTERESHTRPRRIHPRNTIPHRGRAALSDIERRVYKDLAFIGVSINQTQNLSLIRIDHATQNRNTHAPAMRPSAQYNSPSRARRAIRHRRRQAPSDDAYIKT